MHAYILGDQRNSRSHLRSTLLVSREPRSCIVRFRLSRLSPSGEHRPHLLWRPPARDPRQKQSGDGGEPAHARALHHPGQRGSSVRVLLQAGRWPTTASNPCSLRNPAGTMARTTAAPRTLPLSWRLDERPIQATLLLNAAQAMVAPLIAVTSQAASPPLKVYRASTKPGIDRSGNILATGL